MLILLYPTTELYAHLGQCLQSKNFCPNLSPACPSPSMGEGSGGDEEKCG
jgi:hypothetical protein